ncbi:MAG: hypothetical protein KAR20_03235 [Candidatus Heimdallarchaeota archaeon]|nr:hypothetical protein [Candidatus Heimdallarchaeota archaeon]
MSILETTILFEGETLLNKKYYSTTSKKVLDKKNRDNLMNAILGLSSQAFDDEIKNFVVGDYSIAMIKRELEDLHDSGKKIPIRMYSIVENGYKQKELHVLMEDALFQFTNRFSRIDIFTKDQTKFVEFMDRFDKIFASFIEKEDKSVENEVKEMNAARHYSKISSNAQMQTRRPF